jgi:dihydrolipoamide dehydrogenase-binding protein of pyruvate dehydrogenase complex
MAASGPHEVLLKGDVLNHIKQNNLKPKSVEEMSSSGHGAGGPSKSGAKSPAQVPSGAQYVDIETSNMRRIIAKRLTQSKTTIPHAYMTANCGVGAVVKERMKLKKAGVAVSVNDYIIKAAGIALKRVPQVNASWIEGENRIEQLRTVDISIAVATPTGLITPIVQNANQLTVGEISQSVRKLAEKARDGKLQPHEFQGGSFSISNLGMFGITEFVAVINPPQSAILAIGTSRVTLRADGAPDQVMTVTLSYDGRVIEEEVAAKFLETFKQIIEDPVLMEEAGDGSDNRRLNALIS